MDSVNNGPKFGGDAWLELQAFKTRQINRREKLNRHKDLINGIASQNNNNNNNNQPTSSHNPTSSTSIQNHEVNANTISQDQYPAELRLSGNEQELHPRSRVKSIGEYDRYNSQLISSGYLNQSTSSSSDRSRSGLGGLETVECLLLLKLCDVALKLPIDSKSLQRFICKIRGYEQTSQATIENLLEKFAHQELITIEQPVNASLNRSSHDNDDICTYVISADHTKLVEFDRAFGSNDEIRALLLEAKNDDLTTLDELDMIARQSTVPLQNIRRTHYDSNHHQQNDQTIYANSESLALLPGGSQSNKQSSGGGGGDKTRQNLQRTNNTIVGISRPAKDDVESLLSLSSTRERESKKLGEELLELLSKPTAKEKNLLESFRSADGYQVQEFCPKGTKDECRRNNKGTQACDKLHFKKIIAKHTEESLGDCSFLNTCFHMDSCKYVHYEVDYDSKHLRQTQRQHNRKQQAKSLNSIKQEPNINNITSEQQQPMSQASRAGNNQCKTVSLLSGASARNDVVEVSGSSNHQSNQVTPSSQQPATSTVSKYALSPEEQARVEIRNRKRYKTVLYPPQWIQCDLRYFDMSLLGKFSVVMADPPWDIHMELPYGTMSDDEMRKLNVPALQDDGVIFLWVTGRAMELGRECLALWGYERCDEIIWVKTNQLQRIIRTGRTGHWLNHGKEHCLVGVKGKPTGINRGLDCDIIVAEVRATSHKPDEIYGIIERLSPGTRKIELFGRAHNVQPNWITLGNQLDGVRLVEPSLIEAFKDSNLPYQVGEHAA